MLGLSGVVEGCRRTGGGGKGGREREELSKVAKAVGGCEGVDGPGSDGPGEELRGGPGRERDVEATPGVESRCGAFAK